MRILTQNLQLMLTSLASIVVPSVPIVHVVLSTLGVIPKLGPGRALFLAVRSLLFPPLVRENRPRIQSCRPDLVPLLQNSLRKTSYWGDFASVSVTGDPGVGKSTLIDDTLHRFPGVVNVQIPPDLRKGAVLKLIFKEITGSEKFSSLNQAQRVMNCYQWLRYPKSIAFASFLCYFITPWIQPEIVGSLALASSLVAIAVFLASPFRIPVLILRIQLVGEGDFTGLSEAIKSLENQAVVLVEENGSSIRTASSVDVLRLNQSETLLLPEAQTIRKVVDDELWNLVWQICGGIPKHYTLMVARFLDLLNNSHDHKIQIVEQYLLEQVSSAVQKVKEEKEKISWMNEAINKYDPKTSSSFTSQNEKSQSKVLRPGMKFILDHKIVDVPKSFNELRKYVTVT